MLAILFSVNVVELIAQTNQNDDNDNAGLVGACCAEFLPRVVGLFEAGCGAFYSIILLTMI
jgi:hypothetical protein